ncbi:RNA polymerase sigma factor [Chitinophagaceae bacterium MMS25-I14]
MAGNGDESVHAQLHLLIRDCIAHDRRAQKKLYDTYSPFVYGVIRRYVPAAEHAAEILNDSFYRIFTRLEQYSFQGAFEAWLRRITVNQVSDHFRKKINKADHSVTVEDYHAYVDNDILGRIGQKELLNVIHELPEMQRAVFNMYVFDDYSHKEISELLGITNNNSRWHLNDARRRLKEKISLTMRNVNARE